METLINHTPGPDFPPEKKSNPESPEVKPQGIPPEYPPERTDRELEKEERRELDNPNPIPDRPEARRFNPYLAFFSQMPPDK